MGIESNPKHDSQTKTYQQTQKNDKNEIHGFRADQGTKVAEELDAIDENVDDEKYDE